MPRLHETSGVVGHPSPDPCKTERLVVRLTVPLRGAPGAVPSCKETSAAVSQTAPSGTHQLQEL